MKKISIWLLLFSMPNFICISIIAQTTFVYRNPYFFKGESIVFTSEYKSRILLKDMISRFTPSKEDLDSAENIFKKRYNIDLQESKELYVAPVKNVTKEYKHYRRQYLGYINNKEEMVILIQMLNFNDKKMAKRKFEGWESEFEIGLGGWYEGNIFIFEVNLTTNRLSK